MVAEIAAGVASPVVDVNRRDAAEQKLEVQRADPSVVAVAAAGGGDGVVRCAAAWVEPRCIV